MKIEKKGENGYPLFTHQWHIHRYLVQVVGRQCIPWTDNTHIYIFFLFWNVHFFFFSSFLSLSLFLSFLLKREKKKERKKERKKESRKHFKAKMELGRGALKFEKKKHSF